LYDWVVRAMCKPLQIVYTGGESGIRNRGLFHKHLANTGSPSISPKITLRSLIDLFRCQMHCLITRIKPVRNWTQHIYPIMRTYSSTLVHSFTEHTPKVASNQGNQLNVYVNLTLNANSARRYPC
jgi:hypothetical protein